MSKQDILAVLHENNAASAHVISRRLGISRQAVHKQLNTLVAEGIVAKEGKTTKGNLYGNRQSAKINQRRDTGTIT